MTELMMDAPTQHRPWPLPDGSWVMFQEWQDLLFAHWRVDEAILRPLVPPQFPIDTFMGQAWVAVTPFRVAGARPRFVPPVPGISDFLELNVRTYVKVEDKPGVYFFSLDASHALAVTGARTLFHLPYYNADMQVTEDGPYFRYSSRRTDPDAPHAEFRGWYRPMGEVIHAERGSLEYFLTERYCLYTLDDSGAPCRTEIHHPPWPLQVAEAEFEVNTMAEAQGIALPDEKPLLHFAARQPTFVWALERVTG
jgi:uncharacterized protein